MDELTIDDVMHTRPCEIGDIVKITISSDGRFTKEEHVATCTEIHRFCIIFNDGIRNICVNKVDIATGVAKITKGRKKR